MKAKGFLHTASAKAIADNLHLCDEQAHCSADEQRSDEESPDTLAGALRLLLVEEENDDGTQGVGVGSLARSLAMDAAYSAVSNSLIPCLGCSAGGGDETNDSLSATGAMPTPCRCCKVVLLVPGEPKRAKKKRRRDINGQTFLGGTGKAAFPMHCVRDGMEDSEQLNQTMLGQIQVKYVNSLSDVIRYLAYASSLPDHLQPLEGIFLLGLGELLSRENRNTTSIMEFTNLLSLLSDTANVLAKKKNELLKSNTNTFSSNQVIADVSVMATIDAFTYSSIPPKIINYLHQWIDLTASIGPARPAEDGNTVHSEWDLVFENTGVLEVLPKVHGERIELENSFSFCFKSDSHKIVWKV